MHSPLHSERYTRAEGYNLGASGARNFFFFDPGSSSFCLFNQITFEPVFTVGADWGVLRGEGEMGIQPDM